MPEFFYRHALEYRQPVRSKSDEFISSPPLGKSLDIIENVESLSFVDTSCAPRQPEAVREKLAMSPSSTGHGGQYDTQYSPFDKTLRAAFVREIISGLQLEPVCMCLETI